MKTAWAVFRPLVFKFFCSDRESLAQANVCTERLDQFYVVTIRILVSRKKDSKI